MSFAVYRRLAFQGILTVGLLSAGIHFLGQRHVVYGLFGLGGGIASAYHLRLGDGFLKQGRESFEKQNYTQAEQELTEAIKHQAGPEAYLIRAQVRCEQKRWDDAITDLNQVLECATTLGPEATHLLSSAYIAKGSTYFETAQFEQALDSFKQALTLVPHQVHVQTQCGECHSRLGRWHDALVAYSQALTLLENRSRSQDSLAQLAAYDGRAVAYLRLGRVDEGLHDFREALKLQPHSSRYYNHGVTLFYWKQDYAAAIADMTEVIKQDPNLISAYFVRGNAWYELNEQQLAFEDYDAARQLLQQDPDYQLDQQDEHGFFASGMARFRLGDVEGSLADLEKAAELSQIYQTPEFPNQIQTWIRKIEGTSNI